MQIVLVGPLEPSSRHHQPVHTIDDSCLLLVVTCSGYSSRLFHVAGQWHTSPMPRMYMTIRNVCLCGVLLLPELPRRELCWLAHDQSKCCPSHVHGMHLQCICQTVNAECDVLLLLVIVPVQGTTLCYVSINNPCFPPRLVLESIRFVPLAAWGRGGGWTGKTHSYPIWRQQYVVTLHDAKFTDWMTISVATASLLQCESKNSNHMSRVPSLISRQFWYHFPVHWSKRLYYKGNTPR